MRPRSLAEVAQLTVEGESFDLCLKNFLDEFQVHPSANALSEEPAILRDRFPEIGAIQDAYLAAVAESLASASHLSVPLWAFAETRKLHRPWFALNYSSMRAVLLVESPPAFRSRNLFVSENALSRA